MLERHVDGLAREVATSSKLAAAHAQPAGVLVEGDLVGVAGGSSRRTASSRAVSSRRPLGLALARELRALERLRILRVGDLLAGELGERGELAAAPLARRVRDLLVDVVGEELERRPLAVLLAHEQHRREGCQQRAERGERPHLGAAGGRRTRGCRPGRGRRRRRRSARAARPRPARRSGAGGSVEYVPSWTCGRWNALARSATRAELLVVALAVAGEQHAQRVVEVVGPGGVAAPAAERRRAHDLRVVEAGLGDHERARVGVVHAPRDRRDEVLGARVEDRVDRVEAQPVDVEVADPALGALEDPLAHRVGVLVVEVDRLAPERPVRRR